MSVANATSIARTDQQPTDGQLTDSILQLLRGVSNARAQNILKMVGSQYNVRFVSAFAPPVQTAQILPRETRKQKQPRIQPKADPKVKEIRSKISSLNSQISQKSKSLGDVELEKSDPLIVERTHLFRDLKKAQNKSLEAFKEAPQAKADGTPSFFKNEETA
jgi:hypothetical protein